MACLRVPVKTSRLPETGVSACLKFPNIGQLPESGNGQEAFCNLMSRTGSFHPEDGTVDDHRPRFESISRKSEVPQRSGWAPSGCPSHRGASDDGMLVQLHALQAKNCLPLAEAKSGHPESPDGAMEPLMRESEKRGKDLLQNDCVSTKTAVPPEALSVHRERRTAPAAGLRTQRISQSTLGICDRRVMRHRSTEHSRRGA